MCSLYNETASLTRLIILQILVARSIGASLSVQRLPNVVVPTYGRVLPDHHLPLLGVHGRLLGIAIYGSDLTADGSLSATLFDFRLFSRRVQTAAYSELDSPPSELAKNSRPGLRALRPGTPLVCHAGSSNNNNNGLLVLVGTVSTA